MVYSEKFGMVRKVWYGGKSVALWEKCYIMEGVWYSRKIVVFWNKVF